MLELDKFFVILKSIKLRQKLKQVCTNNHTPMNVYSMPQLDKLHLNDSKDCKGEATKLLTCLERAILIRSGFERLLPWP